MPETNETRRPRVDQELSTDPVENARIKNARWIADCIFGALTRPRPKPVDVLSPKDAVLLYDPTAVFQKWGSEVNTPAAQPGWIHGKGWETTITYSEPRAWEVALILVTERIEAERG